MEHQSFITEFAKVIEVDPNLLSLDFDFKQNADWDSLAFISTIALVDKHYGVIIDGDSLNLVSKVNDLYDLINMSKR